MFSKPKIARTKRLTKAILAFSALISLCSPLLIPHASAQTDELPELGDRSTQHLSGRQEKEIGLSFLRQLLRDNDFVSDYELTHYLQSIGNQVAESADTRGTKLTFNLISSTDLNAFAVPGGYITFNTGLLLYTEEESELASVVAHEIAHLSQLHLPRLIARAQDNKLPTTAAIIGSILLGGQLGLAGLTLTNAQLISNQLSYTRDFEREADAIGIQLLANAGFDPLAMSRFFNKLERYSLTQGSDAPEFLRTHPMSYNRIAETEQRAMDLPKVEYVDSLAFHLTKAKIQALHGYDKTNSANYFTKTIPTLSGLKKMAAQYGLAVALMDKRQYSAAEETLRPLVDKRPDVSYFQTLQASIESASGQHDAAIKRLYALADSHPDLGFVSYQLSDNLIKHGKAEDAKQLLRYRLRRHPNDYQLYALLSKANVSLDLLVQAHQADAEYHVLLGDNKSAIESLKLALRDSTDEGYLYQSVAARLKELESQLSYE